MEGGQEEERRKCFVGFLNYGWMTIDRLPSELNHFGERVPDGRPFSLESFLRPRTTRDRCMDRGRETATTTTPRKNAVRDDWSGLFTLVEMRLTDVLTCTGPAWPPLRS